MATHDYVIDNSTGANVRADLNLVLQAILSNNSSSSAPSSTAAYMWWADTSAGILKIRNSANNAWVELLQLDGTLTLEDGSASTPALAFRDDLNTGIFSSAADTFNVATGGVERFVINSSGNCGIGAASPSVTLDIEATTPTIRLTDSDASGTPECEIKGGGGDLVFSADRDNEKSSTIIGFNIDGSEKMRIDSSGRVGIGTTSPAAALDVVRDGNECIRMENTTGVNVRILFRDNASRAGEIRMFQGDLGFFPDGGSEKLIVKTNGNVGIGTTSPNTKLDVRDSSGIGISSRSTATQATDSNKGLKVRNNSDTDTFSVSYKGQGYFAGNVGIGTSSPVNKLEVDNGSSVCFARISTTNTGAGVAGLIIANSSKTSFNDGIKIKHGAGFAEVTGLDNSSICRFNPLNGAHGNFHVFGALSKGSGSFLIDHPLESKKDTHNLVHSFIEGPQADLIYRGKIALSDGSATVNIDTVSGMTSGTFATLNTNVQCFTNNETGWSAVKGSVSGNILTITAEDNSCSDTISWLVIGERQDQHMKETTWTDNDGKVIVEPLKD